jgi:hypothetical protein
VYGDVPSETVEVNSLDWPTSNVAELGEILAEGAVFTVAVAVLEVAAVLTESVTFT